MMACALEPESEHAGLHLFLIFRVASAVCAGDADVRECVGAQS
jgi:hypothetical protein